MIESANTVVEIGPGAGVHGGEIVQINNDKLGIRIVGILQD